MFVFTFLDILDHLPDPDVDDSVVAREFNCFPSENTLVRAVRLHYDCYRGCD